jgi:hypothetical protein
MKVENILLAMSISEGSFIPEYQLPAHGLIFTAEALTTLNNFKDEMLVRTLLDHEHVLILLAHLFQVANFCIFMKCQHLSMMLTNNSIFLLY